MMSNSPGESGGDENGSDGKKSGKRELSNSKRAAQNRAAQVRLPRVRSILTPDVGVECGDGCTGTLTVSFLFSFFATWA